MVAAPSTMSHQPEQVHQRVGRGTGLVGDDDAEEEGDPFGG
jgi:hypothetical protein